MKDRLGAADYRFIAICLALLGGSIWFSAGNFYRAFPEASIDFRVSRGEAQQRAEQFLARQNYATGAYRTASSFSYDDDAKTFLERELGLEKANQLMGTRIRLWRWAFRWFRPQQKEEFRADITATGDFVAFEHLIAEDAARPDITADHARALAEEFLRTRARRDPAALEFVESSSVTRPHRVDRVFTWKERDLDIHDATYRAEVTMLGDEVGGYSEYLKIPDQWTRDYERLRSRNNLAQTIDLAVTFGLMIGLMVVLVQRVRRQDVRWRRAAAIGVVGMGLSFLASLNEFPLAEFGYPTTDAYGSFVAQKLLAAVAGALGWGGALFIIAAGAEVMYREAFPDKVSLGSLFSRRGLRTKRFFLGAILGITLCAIFLAYQTVFYIVANKLGGPPADVPYSDLLNTRFPWLYVLLGGYLPAVSEEFLFRMFAIPYLRKLVRWLPAAIVLAGFIWGFGHAGYPNQPFFIRGLEVGIGGVALGLIMLRWGILPTLIWHYSVDAMYSALLLLRSHSLYFQLSGTASAGIFLVPIAIALVAYWREGGFEPATGMLNGDERGPVEAPPPEAAPADVPVLSIARLSNRQRMLAIAIFVVGLAMGFVPMSHFGQSPNYKLPADEARAPADAFLREQGVDPAGYRNVTYPQAHWGGDDTLAAQYFMQHRTLSEASKLFEQYRPIQHWATRYFKSLEKEEFLVTVQPETGKVMGFNHQLPEDRPGADLSPDEARRIAADFAEAHGVGVGAMDLKESSSEKRKARRDYSLEWEARPGDPRNVDEVHYRVAIEVAGDRVSGIREYWKIPESFERARNRQNFISIAVVVGYISVAAGGMVFGLWSLIRKIRAGQVPWGRTLRVAAIPTVMTAIGLALALHLTIYRGYQTVVPFQTFVVSTSVVLAMGIAFSYVLYGAGTGFVLSFFPECLAAFRKVRAAMAPDAVFLLLAAFGLWHFCHQLTAVLTDRLHSIAILDVAGPSSIGIPAPALAALANMVRSIFSRGALLAVVALAWQRLPQRWMRAPLVLLAAFSMVSSDVRTPGEFALEYLPALATVASVLLFCGYFARRNYLAYVLAIALSAIAPALAELFQSGNAGLEMQGWIAAAAASIGIAWAVGPGLVQGLVRPSQGT